MLSALSLGATLYMPATRPDLWQVVNGEKYPELRSLSSVWKMQFPSMRWKLQKSI